MAQTSIPASISRYNVSNQGTKFGGNLSMTETSTSTLRDEVKGFLFLTVFLVPALTAVLVGGYGFSIWMYQLLVGPPGAP